MQWAHVRPTGGVLSGCGKAACESRPRSDNKSGVPQKHSLALTRKMFKQSTKATARYEFAGAVLLQDKEFVTNNTTDLATAQPERSLKGVVWPLKAGVHS